MLLTRILSYAVFIFLSFFLPGNKLFCQDQAEIDTSEYLPHYFEGALENNLMIAASNGYVSEIERLLNKGADIDGATNEGATPLVFAVAYNQLYSVLSLLAHNPDVNKITANDETPLIISIKNQNAAIAEALIRGGADIDLANKYGATPLHYSSLIGDFSMVDMLLYYGADCNKKAYDGTTPLMAAIWAGHADVADILFQNGANLEARDKDGFTPLLIAAQNGDTLIMSLLIKEGVDIYEKNIYNYNALTLAIESNQLPAVELLLKKGDKWGLPEKDGVNPFDVASAFGRKDIIKILERENVAGRQSLKIDEVSITASSKFNNRDLFAGMSISFKEPLLNAGFFFGCDLKPAFTRVLVEASEILYYQYFDKSSIANAGIFKDFRVYEYASGVKIEASASLSAGYCFGSKFKGTSTAPENKIRIMPAAGLKFQLKHLVFKTDLEYMNTEFYHIGPLWIRIGIAYKFFISKIRSPGKIIKWN